MKKTITLILLYAFTITVGQENSIYDRLQAINNGETTFYNVDGYTITSQTFNYPFTEKKLKKVYRKYAIKKDEVKTKDEHFNLNNYYVTNNDEITEKIVQNNSYYFIEDKKKRITVIQFTSINKRDHKFERILAKAIIENTIPRENYASARIDSINFAGRKIKLGSICNWTNVNTVQCPYNGTMNWSIHKDLEDAKKTVNQQLAIGKSKISGKVIAEENVKIVFEGTKTTAKKISYNITGITAMLTSMTGGKTITIYYVATKVRNYYVSCVLSFWNNDNITKNGLAPLLEEVMLLDK